MKLKIFLNAGYCNKQKISIFITIGKETLNCILVLTALHKELSSITIEIYLKELSGSASCFSKNTWTHGFSSTMSTSFWNTSNVSSLNSHCFQQLYQYCPYTFDTKIKSLWERLKSVRKKFRSQICYSGVNSTDHDYTIKDIFCDWWM